MLLDDLLIKVGQCAVDVYNLPCNNTSTTALIINRHFSDEERNTSTIISTDSYTINIININILLGYKVNINIRAGICKENFLLAAVAVVVVVPV